MADLADHAYAHAVAVIGAGEPALECAAAAVRRGGRSRTAVLGHARAACLGRAAEVAAVDLDRPAPEDLADLAAALAWTRPPVERAIVDLEGRHGLDRTGLGRALGTSTAAAAGRVTAVVAVWQQSLDPVLIAHLGPGGCEGLAAAVGEVTTPVGDSHSGDAADGGMLSPSDDDATVGREAAPPTLRELLPMAPVVLDHAAACSRCADRLRSMVSVRTLVGHRPLDPAPAAVRAAAAPSRLRRPIAPPPLDREPAGRHWRRPVAAVALAVAVALAGGVITAAREEDGGDETVEALTRVPAAGGVLVVDPPSVEGRSPRPVELTNRSERPVEWVAVGDAEWLRVSPPEGRLRPDESERLRLAVTSAAPEGDLRGAVQITGRDGSAAVVRVTATIERPPDVAASTVGCAVEAMVEDEGEVAGAQLHWLEPAATPGGSPAERIETMQASTAGFIGRLPDGGEAITWWVTAADARGNRARTADQVLPADTCP